MKEKDWNKERNKQKYNNSQGETNEGERKKINIKERMK